MRAMIPRMFKEMRESMAKPEPLTLEEMATMREYIQNGKEDSDEVLALRLKHDRFLEEVNLPTEELDVNARMKIRKRARSEPKRYLRYSWAVGAVLVVVALALQEHRPFLLWLSAFALRAQIAEGVVFDGGFTRQRWLSVASAELAYPLYRWLAAPSIPFSPALVYGTLAFAVVLWLAVLFVALDAYRPSLPATKKKAMEKSVPKGNKKRKRT